MHTTKLVFYSITAGCTSNLKLKNFISMTTVIYNAHKNGRRFYLFNAFIPAYKYNQYLL